MSTDVQSTRGKVKRQHYAAWLGAGALTIGVGAAALACGTGVANADSAGTGSSARHTVSASQAPSRARPVAHAAPRPKKSAALIAASTVTAVAAPSHNARPAARVDNSVSSAGPPRAEKSIAHASAGQNALYDLLGRFVELGSAISNFDAVHAIQDAVQTAFINPVHTTIQTVVTAVHTVFSDFGNIVGSVLYAVALPVETPVWLFLFSTLVNSPWWF
jgi:hypothetical protein